MVYEVSLPRRLLHALAALAARALPDRCLLCGEAGADGMDLCPACRSALPVLRHACVHCAVPLPAEGVCGGCLRRPPPLQATRAAFLYAPPLDRLLPRYKFHRDLAGGRLLAQLMAHACAGCDRPDALVPVPLHRARLRQRGYDQALELARPLSALLQLPLHAGALRRIRATAAQSRLDARTRRRNLHGAFQVDDRRPLPAHVVLVDDVMTTGATLQAAAAALRHAGVERVDAWVCARAP